MKFRCGSVGKCFAIEAGRRMFRLHRSLFHVRQGRVGARTPSHVPPCFKPNARRSVKATGPSQRSPIFLSLNTKCPLPNDNTHFTLFRFISLWDAFTNSVFCPPFNKILATYGGGSQIPDPLGHILKHPGKRLGVFGIEMRFSFFPK